ncbi:SIMPL domain-containing protein [Candidatus Uhrbacteria bacterium]|nr:SIMPL domain-containing protein [Candidatus Uhrbacteria bacterium]
MPPKPMLVEMKDKSMLSGAWTGVAIVLVVFLGVQAWKATLEAREVGHAPTVRDTISMTGEGKISAKPTLAEVNLGLLSEGRDIPATQEDNSKKVNAIIAALKGLGIAEADMQTSNYSISPRYEYTDGRQNIIGYSVSQNLAIKVRNLSQVGAVVSKAGELGSNQVNGISFTIDEPSAIQQEARKEAIADAEKKARELANALGVSLVRVVGFSESTPGSPVPPMYFSRLDASAVAAPVPAPEIQAGELDVVANVTVEYEIR